MTSPPIPVRPDAGRPQVHAAHGSDRAGQQRTIPSAFPEPFALGPPSTTASTSFPNAALSTSSAYLYAIQAVNADRSVTSTQTSADYVTTYGYTDNPVTAGATAVKAQHLTELRSAIEALDATSGLTRPSWTNTSLSGVNVKAVHVTELRNALNAFRTSRSSRQRRSPTAH